MQTEQCCVYRTRLGCGGRHAHLEPAHGEELELVRIDAVEHTHTRSEYRPAHPLARQAHAVPKHQLHYLGPDLHESHEV